MDEPTKFDAIQALCPNAEFTLRGDTLEWLKANGDTEPSDSAITTKLAELKTDYDNNYCWVKIKSLIFKFLIIFNFQDKSILLFIIKELRVIKI